MCCLSCQGSSLLAAVCATWKNTCVVVIIIVIVIVCVTVCVIVIVDIMIVIITIIIIIIISSSSSSSSIMCIYIYSTSVRQVVPPEKNDGPGGPQTPARIVGQRRKTHTE